MRPVDFSCMIIQQGLIVTYHSRAQIGTRWCNAPAPLPYWTQKCLFLNFPFYFMSQFTMIIYGTCSRVCDDAAGSSTCAPQAPLEHLPPEVSVHSIYVTSLTLAESCEVSAATFSWEASSSLRSFLICCLQKHTNQTRITSVFATVQTAAQPCTL